MNMPVVSYSRSVLIAKDVKRTRKGRKEARKSWLDGASLAAFAQTLRTLRRICVVNASAENVANFVDQTFIFKVFVFNHSKLFEELSLFARE